MSASSSHAGQASPHPSETGSGSSVSLAFQDAITLQLQLEQLSRKKSAELLVNPPRGSIELSRNRTPAEELSFKLFDGECLQYSDVCCDGLYDLWGDFVGVTQNTPIKLFPRLAQLAEIPYHEGDMREVVVINQRKDPELRELMDKANRLMDEGGLQTSGAVAMVEKLANLACDHLGGACSHAELLERYPREAARVKQANNSVVMHIGQLRVGLSRHRALLLKVLADACQLPCRILRGEFYLGQAGKSGEHSVVMMRFNGHEWMAEMVTHPGRLYRVKAKTVPELTRAQLWGGQREETRSGSPPPPGRTTAAHSFPTMPSKAPLQEVLEGAEEEDRKSSSSGNKEPGLAWSDEEHEPLEDLGNSEEGNKSSSQGGRSSLSSAKMQSHLHTSNSTTRSYDSYSERRQAEVARNVHDMNHRHSGDRSSTGVSAGPLSREESLVHDTVLEGVPLEGQGRLASQESALKSVESVESRRSSLSSPTAMGGVVETPEGGLAIVAHTVADGDGSRSSDEWLPLNQTPSLTLSDEGREVQLDNVHASIKPSKYGTNPWGGPPRARVRGTDARGRTVEFEVEGLTVTHAQNLQQAEKNPQPPEATRGKSEDSRKAGSLESLISRHRIFRSQTPQEQRRSTSSAQQAERQLDNTQFRLGSLALRQTPQPGPSGFGRPVSTPGRPQVAGGGAGMGGGGGTQRSSAAAEARQALGAQQRRSISPSTASARVATLLSGSSPNLQPQSEEPQKTGSISDPTSSRGAEASSSLGYGDSGSSGQMPGSARELARRMSAEIARTGDLDLQRVQNEVELHSNASGKDLLSSNSMLYSMLGMASSLKDADRTRLLQAIMTSAPQGMELPHERSGSAMGQSDDSQNELFSQTTSSILSNANEAEVDFSEVELGPRIGIGCFGEVFKARWRHTTVAVKRLFDQSLSEQSIKEFRQELVLNQRLKHPNVIMYMGACTTPPNLSIITQWAPKGSLFQLLHNPKPGSAPLTVRQKLRMALDIARGMHYLHSAKPPVIHRDLKSMNLLVDSDFSIKVCDFGLARIRSTTWMTGKSQGGTPEWTAPEVLRNLDYNEKSDVYSYGVVLYELATGREPWEEMTPMQVVGAVGWAGNRLEPPPGCTPIFANLMVRCFADDTKDRPSFEEIIRELLEYAKESAGARGSTPAKGSTPAEETPPDGES